MPFTGTVAENVVDVEPVAMIASSVRRAGRDDVLERRRSRGSPRQRRRRARERPGQARLNVCVMGSNRYASGAPIVIGNASPKLETRQPETTGADAIGIGSEVVPGLGNVALRPELREDVVAQRDDYRQCCRFAAGYTLSGEG